MHSPPPSICAWVRNVLKISQLLTGVTGSVLSSRMFVM
jgi:hypothetical protein